MKRRLKTPNIVEDEQKTRHLAQLKSLFFVHLCLVMRFYTRFISRIFILKTISCKI